jgi:DNA-binding SARP family transcriptional activator
MQLLLMDPCREDAHRMAMQCHVLRGERAQALRQYRVCERILRLEFDAAPEEATRALFDQVRLDPSSL